MRTASQRFFIRSCRASCKKCSLRDKETDHGEGGARTYRGSRGLCTSGSPGASPPDAEISYNERQILH